MYCLGATPICDPIEINLRNFDECNSLFDIHRNSMVTILSTEYISDINVKNFVHEGFQKETDTSILVAGEQNADW